MEKILSFFVGVTIILACFTGCSKKSILDPDTPVTLTMWHNYGGEMQTAMDSLVDRYNATIGKEKGIIINVTAISSSSELNESLERIANNSPGAPEMPDIFTGYPKTAMKFYDKNMLVNFDDFFTEKELSAYVNEFVAEGRLENGGLYVFPVAKSTEVLYVNQTLFDRFAEATGACEEDLATFEGISKLSQMYYEYSGGKQFFSSDSWFNFFEVGTAQLGESIFGDNSLSLKSNAFEYIFTTIYAPMTSGGFCIYDGYSSDLSKTGDLVCSTGSSAGILFYGDTITYSDGTIEEVVYNILPYPVFENGEKIALQRGGGLMVAKSDKKREYAACEFIKWLTSAEQNMEFIDQTGYLPVNADAFNNDIKTQPETVQDERIKRMLTSVLSMYNNYTFFYPPSYSGFDEDCADFESLFFNLMNTEHDKFINGEYTDAKSTLDFLTSQ